MRLSAVSLRVLYTQRERVVPVRRNTHSHREPYHCISVTGAGISIRLQVLQSGRRERAEREERKEPPFTSIHSRDKQRVNSLGVRSAPSASHITSGRIREGEDHRLFTSLVPAIFTSTTMRLTRLLFHEKPVTDADVDPELVKGWRKYYNSVTDRGRFNVSASTLAAIGLVIAYFVLKPKKKAVENKK